MNYHNFSVSLSRQMEECYPPAGPLPMKCMYCHRVNSPMSRGVHPGRLMTIVVKFHTIDPLPDTLRLRQFSGFEKYPDVESYRVVTDKTEDMIAVEATFMYEVPIE